MPAGLPGSEHRSLCPFRLGAPSVSLSAGNGRTAGDAMARVRLPPRTWHHWSVRGRQPACRATAPAPPLIAWLASPGRWTSTRGPTGSTTWRTSATSSQGAAGPWPACRRHWTASSPFGPSLRRSTSRTEPCRWQLAPGPGTPIAPRAVCDCDARPLAGPRADASLRGHGFGSHQSPASDSRKDWRCRRWWWPWRPAAVTGPI